MAGTIRPHPQPLSPTGLAGRPLLRLGSQPARSHGHERPRRAGWPGCVINRGRFHLRPLRDERYRFLAVEQDPSRGNFVAKPGTAGFQPGASAPGDHGSASRLNLYRLHTAAEATAPPPGIIAEDDRQQITTELIEPAIGEVPQYLDLLFERDHAG
jgi:hypothetical protein